MNKEVVFLGLSKNNVDRQIMERAETWTLNDFYQTYHFLNNHEKYKVTRIYNIHRNDPEKPNRFVQWKKRYDEFHNAVKVVIKDWGLKNQRIINNQDYVDKFGYEMLQCSLGWLFADAITENVDTIHVMGCDLDKEGEYSFQRPSVIFAMQTAREIGIKVNCVNEEKWISEMTMQDWANLKAVKTIYG